MPSAPLSPSSNTSPETRTAAASSASFHHFSISISGSLIRFEIRFEKYPLQDYMNMKKLHRRYSFLEKNENECGGSAFAKHASRCALRRDRAARVPMCSPAGLPLYQSRFYCAVSGFHPRKCASFFFLISRHSMGCASVACLHCTEGTCVASADLEEVERSIPCLNRLTCTPGLLFL